MHTPFSLKSALAGAAAGAAVGLALAKAAAAADRVDLTGRLDSLADDLSGAGERFAAACTDLALDVLDLLDAVRQHLHR